MACKRCIVVFFNNIYTAVFWEIDKVFVQEDTIFPFPMRVGRIIAMLLHDNIR